MLLLRQEEKGMTEDEMVAWYRQLNGHESEMVKNRGAYCVAVREVAGSAPPE